MAASNLQQELKKKRPFDSPEQAAALNILRTSDRLQTRFLRLFRAYGLTPSQYNVLRILRGEGRPLPCQEVAARTIQVVPALTGLIDRLQRRGLVRRDRCTKDRRVVYLELTEKAERLLGELDEPLRAEHRRLLGHLTRAELQTLSGLLEKARATLGDESPVS